MSTDTSLPILKAADFASDQEVRWCPGCGDYSILAQMKKVLPAMGSSAGRETPAGLGLGVGVRLAGAMSGPPEGVTEGASPGASRETTTK